MPSRAENDKPVYAQVLAVLGDPTGLATLLAEVPRTSAWDPGWNYRAMGQFGNALSPLDADRGSGDETPATPCCSGRRGKTETADPGQ